MGCEPGMGVTHLSIALANYLSDKLGMGTAVAEVGERNAFARLSSLGDEGGYQIHGVYYFPRINPNEIGRIINQGFPYIILDLGSDSKIAREELLRCDGKIVLGSLSPWRKSVYYEFIESIGDLIEDTSKCTFLSLFGDKIDNKMCRRTCKVPVKSVPFIANPFRIEKKEIAFLHTLV